MLTSTGSTVSPDTALLQIQKEFLHGQTSAIAGETAVRTDNTVAGDNN